MITRTFGEFFHDFFHGILQFLFESLKQERCGASSGTRCGCSRETPTPLPPLETAVKFMNCTSIILLYIRKIIR